RRPKVELLALFHAPEARKEAFLAFLAFLVFFSRQGLVGRCRRCHAPRGRRRRATRASPRAVDVSALRPCDRAPRPTGSCPTGGSCPSRVDRATRSETGAKSPVAPRPIRARSRR